MRLRMFHLPSLANVDNAGPHIHGLGHGLVRGLEMLRRPVRHPLTDDRRFLARGLVVTNTAETVLLRSEWSTNSQNLVDADTSIMAQAM